MAQRTETFSFPCHFRKWLVVLCLLAVILVWTKPQLMAQDLTQFSGGQDTWGFAGRQLSIPTDLADRVRACITISKSGIYVSAGNPPEPFGSWDANQKYIEQYDLSGTFVRSWEVSTSALISDISGLASDSDGNVYAFDGGQKKVLKFRAYGELCNSWGSYGTGDGQFSYTRGRRTRRGRGPQMAPEMFFSPSNLIAVDSKKNVYVADSGNQRIQVFDSDGNFLRKFGAPGPLIDQFHAGPMAILVTPDDRLLIYEQFTSATDKGASVLNSVIQFDSAGNFVSRTSTPTPNPNSYPGFGTYSGWDQIFVQTPEGELIIGEGLVNDSAAVFGGQIAVFGFDQRTLNMIFAGKEKNAFFLKGVFTDLAALGAACDPQGNLWMARPDGRVECLERQMRFDVYKPTKAVPRPAVLNVSQIPGSKAVDIDFLVLDSDSSTVDIGLIALTGGTRSWSNLVVPKKFAAMTPASGSLNFSGTLSSGTLGTGALARAVSTGKPYRVSWNAAADMPGTNFASLSFGVIARDDRPEIGVHYVTIPADSSGGAFKISSKPVQENDLSDLWMWLLARGDSRVAVSGNTVVLTAAGQQYISGAPLPNATPVVNRYTSNGYVKVGTPFIDGVAHDGNTTTVQGRAFAYKLINCRPVSPEEKARAQAGRYNLSAVDDNSVVSSTP